VPPDLQHEYGAACSTLHARILDPLDPVIDHGDDRLGHTLRRGGRVEAVIDWEIWSVGDPRVDPTCSSSSPTGPASGRSLR
jgi:hypothetical protein